MNTILKIVGIGLLLLGCKDNKTEKEVLERKGEFNHDLADELKRMAKIDQVAAYIPQGKHKKMTKKQWNSFKDSVFITHQKRLKQIFDKYGFIGFDLAGEQGSQDFWLMVQHSDHNPDFQKEVLEKMKLEVERGNAKSTNYGLLVDRVKLNSGEKQVFGTQVAYNIKTGQAYPRDLEDSLNVNERRKSIGLHPIEEYLNGMSEMHFEMNKEGYIKMGITKPKLYKIE